jgi:hypothetical protein
MKRTRTALSVIGVLLGGILTGCGDSGGGKSDPIEQLSDAEAKAVAMASLAKVINQVVTAVDTVNDTVVTSRSMTVVAKTGVGNLPVGEPVRQVLLDRTARVLAGAKQRASSRAIAQHTDHDGSEVTAAEDGVVSADELAKYLVFKSRTGNAITYTVNPAVACDPDDTTCLSNLQRVTVVQTILTDDSGTIDARVDDRIVVTIGYASNELYLQFDLAEIRAIAETEGSTDFTDVSAFEGQLRLTLKILDETDGAEKVSIGFGIPRAIKIAGTQDGQNVSLDIAVSETVVALVADAGADTATVELGLSAVHLRYLDDLDLPNILHLGGLTGKFTFSADKLVATGVGIGGEAWHDDGANGTQDGKITMSNLDFTSDGASDLVTLDSALNVVVETLDPAASVATTAPASTALMWYEVTTTYEIYDVWEVTSGGPFAMTGTGARAGSLSVAAGSCFKENSVADVFPIEAATCPE